MKVKENVWRQEGGCSGLGSSGRACLWLGTETLILARTCRCDRLTGMQGELRPSRATRLAMQPRVNQSRQPRPNGAHTKPRSDPGSRARKGQR